MNKAYNSQNEYDKHLKDRITEIGLMAQMLRIPILIMAIPYAEEDSVGSEGVVSMSGRDLNDSMFNLIVDIIQSGSISSAIENIMAPIVSHYLAHKFIEENQDDPEMADQVEIVKAMELRTELLEAMKSLVGEQGDDSIDLGKIVDQLNGVEPIDPDAPEDEEHRSSGGCTHEKCVQCPAYEICPIRK